MLAWNFVHLACVSRGGGRFVRPNRSGLPCVPATNFAKYMLLLIFCFPNDVPRFNYCFFIELCFVGEGGIRVQKDLGAVCDCEIE